MKKVRPIILESWKKCLNLGLSPSGKPISFSEKVPPTCIHSVLTHYLNHIDIIYNSLEKIFKNSEFVIIITDNKGYILDLYGDDKIKKLFSESGVLPGVLAIEEYSGTCAPSITIASKNISKVITDEHFFKCLHWAACIAIPIFLETNELIGVIDITSYDKHTNQIENLYLKLKKIIKNRSSITFFNPILYFNIDINNMYPLAFFNSVFYENKSPMLIVDKNGLILDINKNAQALLFNNNYNFFCKLSDKLSEIYIKKAKKKKLYRLIHNNIEFLIEIDPLKITHKNLIGYLIKIDSCSQNKKIFKEIPSSKFQFKPQIIAKNKKMKDILQKLKQIAKTSSSILLEGETGTGKDLLARFVHESSNYKTGKFVAVNCAAIPTELFESEMFGYEEGAYTGARRGGNIGKIEEANNGTLFLDEIQALDLQNQAKLLRVLEERCLYRIGSHNPIELNIRIISATTSNLYQMVQENRFLEALYHRLKVVHLVVPPLRERLEDMEPLIDYFIKEMNIRFNKNIKKISSEVKELFLKYPWPGNVRELRNVIEFAFNLCNDKDEIITINHIKEAIHDWQYTIKCDFNDSKKLNLRKLSIEVIKKAISESKTISEAAQKLGISRSTLYRKINEFKIKS